MAMARLLPGSYCCRSPSYCHHSPSEVPALRSSLSSFHGLYWHHRSFRCNNMVAGPTRYSPRQLLGPRCCSSHPLFEDFSRDAAHTTNFQKQADLSSVGMRTHVDWKNLTNKEFVEELKNMRQKISDFNPTMLCEDERDSFCLKRYAVAKKLADEFSKMVGDADLETTLQRQRGRDSPMMTDDFDISLNNLPFEEFSKSDIEEAARM